MFGPHHQHKMASFLRALKMDETEKVAGELRGRKTRIDFSYLKPTVRVTDDGWEDGTRGVIEKFPNKSAFPNTGSVVDDEKIFRFPHLIT